MTERLFQRFVAFLEREHLVDEGNTVVLAVSGGPDSMAMFDLFLRIAEKYRLRLIGAHLNHRMREEASEDARFVETYLRRHRIEVFTKEMDVKSYAKEKGLSLEEAGRKARYAFFEEVRQLTGANVISLAHNLDDLIETILYRLVKGTGPRGMVAMKPKDGVFIRPLLYFTASELRNYVTIKGIPYRIDSTNFDIKIPRNLIRHIIVTKLKDINPNLHKSFARFHRLMRELTDYLDHEVDEFIKINAKSGFLGFWEEVSVAELCALHEFVLKEVLRRLAVEFSSTGYAPGFERIEAVVEALKKSDSWIVETEGGVVFERSGDRMYISSKRYYQNWSDFVIDRPGVFSFGSFELLVRELQTDEVGSADVIAGRRDKDTFLVEIPAEACRFRVMKAMEIKEIEYKGYRKEVRDLLREAGVPKFFRSIWPCIVDETGEVVWIPGVFFKHRKREGGIVNYVMELRGGKLET